MKKNEKVLVKDAREFLDVNYDEFCRLASELRNEDKIRGGHILNKNALVFEDKKHVNESDNESKNKLSKSESQIFALLRKLGAGDRYVDYSDVIQGKPSNLIDKHVNEALNSLLNKDLIVEKNLSYMIDKNL